MSSWARSSPGSHQTSRTPRPRSPRLQILAPDPLRPLLQPRLPRAPPQAIPPRFHPQPQPPPPLCLHHRLPCSQPAHDCRFWWGLDSRHGRVFVHRFGPTSSCGISSPRPAVPAGAPLPAPLLSWRGDVRGGRMRSLRLHRRPLSRGLRGQRRG
jgi:hypothetical protein